MVVWGGCGEGGDCVEAYAVVSACSLRLIEDREVCGMLPVTRMIFWSAVEDMAQEGYRCVGKGDSVFSTYK